MGAKVLVVDDSPTIRKLVRAILEAQGYEVRLAGDGIEALEALEGGDVDLTLLDFVMPRMNGFQFCREIRNSEQHKDLAVVLMSAKGDKIRGQFVRQTGAIDSITKPFDARGLLAVVEGALRKKEQGVRRPSEAPEEEAAFDASGPHLHPSRDPGLHKAQGLAEFKRELCRHLLPSLERSEALSAVTVEELRAALAEAATEDTLAGLGRVIKILEFGEDDRQVLAGDLSAVSIAEVLQLFAMQRQSGALSVFHRKSEIVLHLRQGELDYAEFRGLSGEFLLGRYLVEAGHLSREELQIVLGNRAGSKRLLGESLAVLGFVDENQVRKALVRQTSELVYELVRWQNGRFVFHVGTPNPIAEKSKLGLPTAGLVMEGFRRVDEWRVIEGSFDFDEVLYRDPTAFEQLGDTSQLTPRERQVLGSIDGEATVREVVDQMGGSSFDVCKILYQLLNSRLVRRRTN
jgi:DNA-binding response OmpR family regulator